MPRIRISAAKNHLRAHSYANGCGNHLSPITGVNSKFNKNVVGGLTSGNLSKIAGEGQLVNNTVQDTTQASLRLEEQMSGEQIVLPGKQRKNYARGISHQVNEDKKQSALRQLSELAPSAHHRFDKDQVHLRYMYRQLHPGEAAKTRNKRAAHSGFESASQGSLNGGDYRVEIPVIDRSSVVVQ